ncbi:HTH_Tnp_Tc3_2 domain-containing protein [Trichonephila clavipes]|nr:HTH_Tnp_Tc3_2 domain-containing protein [Trichonephila clavipes]
MAPTYHAASEAEIRATVGTTVTQRTVKNRFCHGTSDVHVFVRRMPGECLQANALWPIHTGPTPGVMVTIACEITRSLPKGARMRYHWTTVLASHTTSTGHPRIETTTGRIIGRLECGRTQLEVFEELVIAQSVTSRLWQRFQDDATGTTVSKQTMYGRLGHIGVYARRSVRCVPLTATHCRL